MTFGHDQKQSDAPFETRQGFPWGWLAGVAFAAALVAAGAIL